MAQKHVHTNFTAVMGCQMESDRLVLSKSQFADEWSRQKKGGSWSPNQILLRFPFMMLAHTYKVAAACIFRKLFAPSITQTMFHRALDGSELRQVLMIWINVLSKTTDGCVIGNAKDVRFGKCRRWRGRYSALR